MFSFFVTQELDAESFKRKISPPRLSCLSVYGYYCLEMFAQHKLVRVNINKVLLSWVLQHIQTSHVNSVGRAHTEAVISSLNGTYCFCFLVFLLADRQKQKSKTYRLSLWIQSLCLEEIRVSYLLSSCQLWSISSVGSICTDFACLCPQCIVCWTWKVNGNKFILLQTQKKRN